MKRKVQDYVELYLFAKEYGVERAMEEFGVSRASVTNVLAIGDDFDKVRPIPPAAKTIDKFTPRELMTELARRGYCGELTFTQKINIKDF